MDCDIPNQPPRTTVAQLLLQGLTDKTCFLFKVKPNYFVICNFENEQKGEKNS